MKYHNKGIIEAGNKDYNIKTFTWHLIDVCNQSCSYCNEGFGTDETRPKSSFFKNDKQTQSYLNVLKRLKIKSLGKYEVDLLGGEPTLHDNLFKIIQTLNTYDNCVEISLITNLKKNISYYETLNKKDCSKLLICPSVHMEYYNESIIEKIIKINEFEHVRIIPIIMIHDNKKYYQKNKELITRLIQEGIDFTVSFLADSYEYSVNYDKDFLSEMADFAKKDNNRYIFKTNDNKIYNLNKHSIYDNKLTKFKGWKCTPLRYKITHFGGIFNDCTKKPLSITGKAECVECPLSNCGCDIQWNYYKQKV
jgi:MoaA/NifB/PqqE/SkfB family radical SAM enzyme